MRISDWSSDVCSSDLISPAFHLRQFRFVDQALCLRSQRARQNNKIRNTQELIQFQPFDIRLFAIVLSTTLGSHDIHCKSVAAHAGQCLSNSTKEIGGAPCRERVCNYVRTTEFDV